MLGLLLFLSGAAGLSYEVVWLRLLANAVGCAPAATATVLAVFMGGLALGAAAAGPLAVRLARPLRAYGLLELALGAYALAAPRLIGATAALDRQLGGGIEGALPIAMRIVATAVVLLPPTLIMGATWPVLGAAFRRSAVTASRRFTLAYAAQLAGAATGTLAASFVLIPRLGLSGTSMAGALANLIVAIGAWSLREPAPATSAPAQASDAAPLPAAPPPQPAMTRAACALGFASGFLLLAAEGTFTRILVMTVSAKVHSFALMLAVFLIGLALASALAAALPASVAAARETPFLALVLGAAGLLVAGPLSLRCAEALLVGLQEDGRIEPAAYVALASVLAGATMLPCVLPLGMVFPLVLRGALQGGSAAVGRVTAWNTAGAVLGAPLAAWLLVPRLGLLGSLWGLALGALATAALLGAAARGIPLARRLAGGAILAGGAALLAVAPHGAGGTPSLDTTLFLESRVAGVGEPPRVLHHREGATATVSVVQRRGGRRSLRLDGFEAAGAPVAGTSYYQYLRLMAHLPALLHPRPPERALVICCGTGTTAGAMSLHARDVDLVDLHPEVLACLGWFTAANRNVAGSARCASIAEDGRAWLRRCGRRYDVITLEPMPPQHAGMTQLYSREFYGAAAAALADDGVICQWLPYHLLAPRQALAIVRAMDEVFACVQVWEHRRTGLLIGSRRPLALDRTRLSALLADRRVRDDLEEAGLTLASEWADAFLCDAAALRGWLVAVDPVRDDRPTLEYAEIGFGLSRLTPAEEAAVRAPMFAARLECELPLRDFEPDEAEAIAREWRIGSVARFATYLDLVEGAARARAFVAERQERRPELRDAGALRAWAAADPAEAAR